MSKKSTQNTGYVSGERRNTAGDVDHARSAVEQHHESDAKYVESDDEATIVESDGSETSEHSYTPSEIEELIQIYENHGCLMIEAHADEEKGNIQVVSTDSEADKEGDNKNVCGNDEEQGLSELHLSAERGDTEVVRSLLMSSANVDVLDTKHNTPLHYATLNGHVDVVNLLLSKNASVDSRNASGQTSLHLAAEIGHLAIAQLLLENNADVHITDQSNNTPIHIAAMHGHYELVQLLMKYNDDPLRFTGNTPLHLAAKFGHTKALQLLLNHNHTADATNLDGDTPLHLASQNGHFEVVEVLLRNNADSNILNDSGKTALHIAAELGYAELVRAIIDNEGEVNTVDGSGDTALHLAASNGHSAVVNVLLNQTTEIDAQFPSQLAVSQVPPAELELSKHPIRNTVDLDHTPRLIAAESGITEIADTLMSRSSTVTAGCKGQTTPLHLAVKREHAEIGKNLMFNGANVNACNKAKMTPLHLACQNGHTSIVQNLLDNHAVVDVMKQSEETPFYLAAENGHADITDLLLRRGVCNFVQTCSTTDTPLHVAVGKGHTNVVEVILKHNCRISDRLTKEELKLQENAKNLVETRGVIPAELLKLDGRRVSAGIVWKEVSIPLELRTGLKGCNALELAALSVEPKMVRLLLSGDQCEYSEQDLHRCFTSIISSIDFDHFLEKDLIDLEQHRMNFRESAQLLINSSKFNVNHQDNELSTLLHEVMYHGEYSSGRTPELSKFHNLRIHIINDVTQLLLKNGADFNIKNYHGVTPLIIAAENGCCHAIQILFDWEQKSGMKLDLDAKDEYGATALIKAAEMHHVSVMRLLLNHKASVNLYDYYGFTALHAAIYEPSKNWFDLHFFCKGLRKRKFGGDDHIEMSGIVKPNWEKETLDPYTVIDRLRKNLEYDKATTRIKEEVVKLLLANDETDVNAMDFRGNTPLDLAVKSFKRINSAILKALKNRGAIRNLLDPEDEASIDVAWVDKRGRNPLHRLIISHISGFEFTDANVAKRERYQGRNDLMVYGILRRSENFMESATATDEKGRTPLHYAVMQPSYLDDVNHDFVRMLLQLGANVNAADVYGKTPLHYAEMNDKYELLVQYGADENTKDKHGHTPRDLWQRREWVTINEDNATELPIGKKAFFPSADIAKVLNTNHVTELSKQNLVETVRIYSQSPRPQESSEESIWKIWTENEFIRLNRHLSQLKPSVQHFIERLADGIKERDWRFESQPTLVGSADEETKVNSADFDFNFRLIKFSQFCDPIPHPLGQKGYFQLRRKPNEDI